MKNMDRWINDYINNVDLEKIEWIKLNSKELSVFFENNYLDRKAWKYVHDENANGLFPTLLGMKYLNFNNPLNDKDHSFLLGIVNNNIGKKTIVAATMYLDEYFLYTNQEKPVTYISTMEVNSYFRNRGIYKNMCEALINFINPDQHILTSGQSDMGAKCNAFELLRNGLISNGFKNYIYEDDRRIINSELYNAVCFKKKILNPANKN